MKIAIAQFDARLGDIESICSRIKEQSRLAITHDAKLLCVPAPLFCGVAPGLLIDNRNFEHDVMRSLLELASCFSGDELTILVPLVVSIDGAPLFDVIMLKEGRVIPSRLFSMHQREGSALDIWAPPIFEVGGLRVAVSFDAQRDLPLLPQGCDVLVYFQASSFNQDDCSTAGVSGLIEGSLCKAVRDRGIWLAAVCPVGSFDESVYTGGSYFLDESARLISAAPSFEESLLIQDVVRGTLLPEVAISDDFRFNKEEWLWNALQIYLRDSLSPYGSRRVVVELDGSLASSLLAVLAVDSIGSRNVIGLLVERDDAIAPEQVEKESLRRRLVRDLSAGLHIRLVTRSAGFLTESFDRDRSCPNAARSESLAVSVILEDLADEYAAVILSPLTKTDYSLPGKRVDRYRFASLAPFGDVFLTDLEFVARYRNRLSEVLPSSLVSLPEVEAAMSRVLYDAIRGRVEDRDRAAHAAEIFYKLDASQVDDVLRAAVDQGRVFEEIGLARSDEDAVALLLLMTRAGEGDRRRMAPYPIVSSRSFSERAWPSQLAWSDMGRDGQESLSADGFALDEIHRFEKKGEQFGRRMREEIAGLIGGMLGISPEQLRSMMEGGQERQRADADDLDTAVQGMPGSIGSHASKGSEQAHLEGIPTPRGMNPSDFPFFAIN